MTLCSALFSLRTINSLSFESVFNNSKTLFIAVRNRWNEKGFNRFFAWLSAFVFSMMILVMSDNFAGLFIGWVGVGLCSWGLIGFWYHKESATWAANEAFIMNRI